MQPIRIVRDQALSLALFALLPLSAVSIQGQLQAQRTQFVVHYYADSIYGDDTEANTHNPKWRFVQGQRVDQMLAPHRSPGNIGGILQHAPYSFRTVTAAVAHIRSQFPAIPMGLSNGNSVQDVVIHCAPGLYGPTLLARAKTPGPELDTKSGLPWNGETFPIDLPERVSIQGTSALDTIFDGRGDEGFRNYIFRVSNPIGLDPNDPTVPFIAHVTIRGAASDGGINNGAPKGAGIFIDGSKDAVEFLVHNCFIVENTIGIAMTSNGGSTPSRPAIVNNTIAWNLIGIWSGYSPFSAPNHLGLSEPRVLNNLIDPFHPLAPSGGSGRSAFEGVHWHDLEVNTGTGSTGWNTINAWEGPASGGLRPYGWANLGATAPGWPATNTRAPSITTSPTGKIEGLVDITPITFGKTLLPNRGTLFVNDLLRNHGGSDLSPHDFRLSVYTPPNTSIGVLVNQGASPGSFSGSVVFRSGQVITNISGWGFTTGKGNAYNLEKAQMNVGAWDAEGFGNVRSYLRRGWSSGPFSSIDLGADELGDLIMAGYIFRTRIFSMNVPNAPGISSHNLIHFVDAPNRKFSTSSQAQRPLSNAWVGQSWSLPLPAGIDNSWWKQAQFNPNPPASSNISNYTDGVLQSVRRATLDPYRPPFMRNLQCDFAPHLLLNINPMWPAQLETMFFISPSRPIGIYACNPWFDGVSIPGYGGTYPDNPFLYYNLTGGGFPIPVATYVQVGLLNSPGSYLGLTAAGLPSGAFLEPSLSKTQFGPYGGGIPSNRNYYETNSFGLGDSIAIDPILNTGDLGMRVNCQVNYGGDPTVWSNLQSFLEVYVNQTPAASKAAATKVPRPTQKEQEEMLKKIFKRYRR